VLIRAVEPVFGEALMRQRRPVATVQLLTNGPAKLCQAMGIQRGLDGSDLCDPEAELFIATNPEVEAFRKERGKTVTTVRIGLSQAADLPLRFYLSNSPFVSKTPKKTPTSSGPSGRAILCGTRPRRSRAGRSDR
jgi:DNA-3-methyladenine glycosylase